MRLKRLPLSQLTLSRISLGGRVGDAGRLPRYILSFFLCLFLVWVPIGAYIKFAPKRYTSDMVLILPGAGASTSINLAEIGQASSSASSAYSSSTLSPTVTYQNLLQSPRLVQKAARAIGEEADAIGKPTVKLLDQTSLINVTVSGGSPQQAQARAQALLDAFMHDLDKLRTDEIVLRENATSGAVQVYRQQVETIRGKIVSLQTKSGLTSREQYNTYVTTNDSLRAKIAELDAALAQIRNKINSLSLMLRVTPDRAAMILKLRADPLFIALAETLAKNDAVYAELSARLGANHPRIAALKGSLTGIRRQMNARADILTSLSGDEINREIDTATDTGRAELMAQLVTLVSDRDGAAAQLLGYRATLAEGEKKVRSLRGTVVGLDALDSDYKVAEAVFASALARINTSKTDVFASYPMVQVAAVPTLPDRPSSPSILIGLAAGGAATIFLLIAFALAWIRRPLLGRIARSVTQARHAG